MRNYTIDVHVKDGVSASFGTWKGHVRTSAVSMNAVICRYPTARLLAPMSVDLEIERGGNVFRAYPSGNRTVHNTCYFVIG